MVEQEQTIGRPGQYKLVELIEEGISGKLYRARDTERQKTVLIKLVAKSRSNDPEFQRYFHDRRAEQDALFRHPNIAQVLEMGERGEQYYVAVEDPEGERLCDKLKQAPLDPDEVLGILHQIAEALRAAHRREITHGHLKPSDVFITHEPTVRRLVKVLFVDIGVAAAESILPLFGETHGAPKYMAPEVIEGGMLEPQSDLFALGVIGYELLTGTEPFPSKHPMGYLFANCQKSLVPPHEARQDVPRELSLVVSRCLEKDPRRRYRSAQRLIDDLDRCLQSIKDHCSGVSIRLVRNNVHTNSFSQAFELVNGRRSKGIRRCQQHRLPFVPGPVSKLGYRGRLATTVDPHHQYNLRP